jgi:hypothetical protein
MSTRQITNRRATVSSRTGPQHNNLHFARPSEGVPITAWVAAPPKSGSTWLSMMLSWLLDWPVMSLIAKAGRQEQEIRVSRTFVQTPTNLFLPHTHTKAGEVTINFVRNFKVKVIIPTRSIDDNLVSVHDHLTQLGVALPIGYISPTYPKMDVEEQKEILIRMVLTWYINFYACWAYAEVEHGIKPLYLPYEQTVENPNRALERCVNFIGIKRSSKQIQAAVDQANNEPTRYNYGVTGRGIAFFSQADQVKINEMMSLQKDPIIVDALQKVRPAWVTHYAKEPERDTEADQNSENNYSSDAASAS